MSARIELKFYTPRICENDGRNKENCSYLQIIINPKSTFTFRISSAQVNGFHSLFSSRFSFLPVCGGWGGYQPNIYDHIYRNIIKFWSLFLFLREKKADVSNVCQKLSLWYIYVHFCCTIYYYVFLWMAIFSVCTTGVLKSAVLWRKGQSIDCCIVNMVKYYGNT